LGKTAGRIVEESKDGIEGKAYEGHSPSPKPVGKVAGINLQGRPGERVGGEEQPHLVVRNTEAFHVER